jgi:hypothetical protein
VAEGVTAALVYQLDPFSCQNPLICAFFENKLIDICFYMLHFVLFNGISYGTMDGITKTFFRWGPQCQKKQKNFPPWK